MKVADMHCDTILAILRGKEQGKEISLCKNNLNLDLERMKKGDYLIQNFYQVDNTTTINSSQLNAEELLSMDLTIKTPADQPQILIYHTHSQEMFADSDPNDVMTGVMGTGEYLTSLLQEKYGLITLGDGSYIITAYPVKIVFEDILLIVLAVLSIGYTASYFPVKYLVNKLAK